MAKHFTKSIFNTIIQAFYKEIRDNKGKLGEPNVVIYRYDKPDFTFNPRKDMKVGKDTLTVGNEVINYKEIRGVNFYFDNEESVRAFQCRR